MRRIDYAGVAGNVILLGYRVVAVATALLSVVNKTPHVKLL